MSAARLTADAVVLRRGSRVILDEVTVAVPRGAVVALVGPNGAGKSTLLHLLAGDLRPDAGSVHLDGELLSEVPVGELARRRAVLMQANDVSFPFTVREVVAMGRAPWRSSSSADLDDALIDRGLLHADIVHLAGRRVTGLSGGEAARTAYARVVAQAGEILLLDEPTASLDIRHQERLLAQLTEHAAGGGSAVVVLHDLDLAAAYADEIVLLAAGRVRASGRPAEVLTSTLLTEVYQHPITAVPDGADGVLIRPHRSRRDAGSAASSAAADPPAHPESTPEESIARA